MINAQIICRSCGSADLKNILSLGNMPLANSLLKENELTKPEPKYPLDLVFCPHCNLVQITETVPPEKLFGEYLYFSSFSDTMLCHARELVERLVVLRQLNEQSLIVEIASNDGYLLQYYKQKGIPILGIEPAKNIARVALNERGIPTLCEFFGVEIARKMKGQGLRADVIHANNVLAHVSDLNGFIEGIELLLKPDGMAIIEVPYLRNLIDHCEFDTIYHEHLCYFSLLSLNQLFQRHRLTIQDVECNPIHGGSLRLFIGKGCQEQSAAVLDLLNEEAVIGMNHIGYYKNFAKSVEYLKTSLIRRLSELKQDGKQIAAYGAAAKGSILLNYFGIDGKFISFVVDRSVYKQGLFMPGVHLPICAPGLLVETLPNYVLLLSWNFAEEILAQQAEYRTRGGRFIIPIPNIKEV